MDGLLVRLRGPKQLLVDLPRPSLYRSHVTTPSYDRMEFKSIARPVIVAGALEECKDGNPLQRTCPCEKNVLR